MAKTATKKKAGVPKAPTHSAKPDKKGQNVVKQIKRRETAAARDAAASLQDGTPWSHDPDVVSAKDRMHKVLANLDLSDAYNKIARGHAESRELRAKLTAERIIANQQKTLISATLNAQHVRSEAIDTKMSFMRAVGAATSILDTARSYIRNNYGQTISALGGTKEERQGTIDSLFADEIEKVRRFEALIEFVDVAVADHDQAYWAIRNCRDVMAMSVKTEI